MGKRGLGNSCQSNPGNSASWREAGDWYTAESSSQASQAAEEFQHASFGELRLSIFGFASRIEAFQPDRLGPSHRTITSGIIPRHAKTVVPVNHPAARGYMIHKDSSLGCACSTAGKDKVYDQSKRILCTLNAPGKPMVIESRKVNCGRPLMAVTEMTDGGHWVCFGPQRQGFRLEIRRRSCMGS